MGWPPEGSAAVCEVNLGDTFAGGEGFGFYPPAMMAAEPPRAAETTIRSWPTSEESSTMKRKQSHNAYERDRRKKMNGLYSSLRSLLPESEHNKKLSIPNTVSKVLDYVPDLQRQVERLARRKEEIVARISREREKDGDSPRIGGGSAAGVTPLVSVADLGGGEMAIQICASSRGKKGLVSTVLEHLEAEGLAIVSASFLAVNTSRGLLSLHCQVKDATAKVEPGKLRKSLPAVLR